MVVCAAALARSQRRESQPVACACPHLTRQVFSPVELRSFDLLWRNRAYVPGNRIEIKIEPRDGWPLAMEFIADSTEQIYARPVAEVFAETLRATYTLGAEDVGKKVKVQVSFTDNLNGKEMRSSAAHPSTGTVAAALHSMEGRSPAKRPRRMRSSAMTARSSWANR